MNMDIWVVGKSNQLVSYTEKTSTKKVVIGKTPFFVIGTSCTPHSISLKACRLPLAFSRAVLYENILLSILILPTKKQYSRIF